jgi:hypothetical protein
MTNHKNKQLLNCKHSFLALPSTSVPSVSFVPYFLLVQKWCRTYDFWRSWRYLVSVLFCLQVLGKKNILYGPLLTLDLKYSCPDLGEVAREA